MPPPPSNPDILVQDYFSLLLLCPETAAGLCWIDEHLPDSARLGLNATVEPRFADDILSAMQHDGLVLQRGLVRRPSCSTT